MSNDGGFLSGETVPEPKGLFYALSFFIPIAGIIIGAIYMGKADPEVKKFGKNCLIFALIPIILYFIFICCIFAFYIIYFIGIFGVLGIIGIAGSGYSSLAPLIPIAICLL